MQLQMGAQAGAQAAWNACDPGKYTLPATTSSTQCGVNLLTTVTSAAQSTSLGTSVTVSSIVEGYYCADASGNLLLVGSTGTIGSPPAKPTSSCKTVVATSTSETPGDYLQVTTSYTYAPIFSGLSIASALTTPITQTAWVRLK
jgi:hypothetical protein